MLQVRFLTVSHKPPVWVDAAFSEYTKRLSSFYKIQLIEIPVVKRIQSNHIQQYIDREGEKLLAAHKSAHKLIALDIQGKQWSTLALSKEMQKWQIESQNIDIMIGGPDGLSNDCLKKADTKWSLSPLTFPHLLVRVLVAEQLYRGWTILTKHPYHK